MATQADSSSHKALSVREIEIARLIARGLENDQIAIELSISPTTVKAHVSSLFDKLNVPNRLSIVTALLKEGIITLKEC